MAWNEPGGNGNQHDPWGNGGRKPNQNSDNNGKRPNQGPPDLDAALKNLQEKLGKFLGGKNSKQPSKFGGMGLIGIVLVLIAAIWAASGFYLVDQAERGVVLRLGKYHETVMPGLRWNPPIVDSVSKVNVTRIRSLNQRTSMLTKDENIVRVNISVQYLVNNPKDFLLNVRSPERTLEFALDSALRHEVGNTDLMHVLTEGREALAADVKRRLQYFLDSYAVGVTLETINIENTSAPEEVQAAFDDVIRAREDRERSINQANTYKNQVVPEAKGRAARITEEAMAYEASVIARSEGEANRFLALLAEYRKAPQVTRERIYITTMEEVLANTSKVLVDTEKGSSNLLYLPLDKMNSGATPSQRSTTATSGTGATNGLQEHELDELTNRVVEQIRDRQNSSSGIRREGR